MVCEPGRERGGHHDLKRARDCHIHRHSNLGLVKHDLRLGRRSDTATGNCWLFASGWAGQGGVWSSRSNFVQLLWRVHAGLITTSIVRVPR